jgi:SpoVK/Ycf46/Vps4 family AAA+-type ATPase
MKSFKTFLNACVSAGVPAVAVNSTEWERVGQEVFELAKSRNMYYLTWDFVDGLQKGEEKLAGPENPVAMLEALEVNLTDSLVSFNNFNPMMKHPAVQQKLRRTLGYCKANGITLVFISTSGEIPPELEKEILILDFELPDKEAIQNIISGLGDFSDSELCPSLVEAAVGLTMSEAENMIALALVKNELEITPEVVSEVKRQKAQILKKSGTMELIEPDNIPNIGGLDQIKLWMWERGKAFSPEAREFGLPYPKGCLVFGIPGTGKSLFAKAVSKQLGFPLLSLQNVLDKYVGESEKRMKEALKIAEHMAPAVLWIDEVEKFFAGVGGSSDSGVSTRVFGQFLSWLQETTAPVFVVATANNIGALPPELLRKGRFDEIWFVDLPGQQEREEIFKIHISRKGRNIEDFDIPKLAKETSGYTGSEIEQIVISGLFRAFSRKVDISTEILLEAAEETSPLSVTMKEQIAEMREWGKSRARLASFPEMVAPETQVNAYTRKLRL